jgi:type IV pilus assembly protein PilC
MAEFLIKIADERGHLTEHLENGYSEAEVRDRFVQQGFMVYWVKPRGVLSGDFSLRRRGKVKQSQFLIFNQQFLTLIRAGLPILGSLNMLAKGQKDAHFAAQLDDVANRSGS